MNLRDLFQALAACSIDSGNVRFRGILDVDLRILTRNNAGNFLGENPFCGGDSWKVIDSQFYFNGVNSMCLFSNYHAYLNLLLKYVMMIFLEITNSDLA